MGYNCENNRVMKGVDQPDKQVSNKVIWISLTGRLNFCRQLRFGLFIKENSACIQKKLIRPPRETMALPVPLITPGIRTGKHGNWKVQLYESS